MGRVDEAKVDIDRALRLDPNDSQALALQTIIAIVQNDKERAFAVAKKAVEAAPDSATAQIALSYAQQARFDLDGARASLEKAVHLEPHNALAWARLAELQASFGELKKAFQAAQQAVDLEPNLARTQTVLGYTYLIQVKTTQAKNTFEKAIVLDQADPLPRLGLGLAKIREGQLDQGGREIEIAASLDPNNALIRSYLGKTYYEEKRIPLDEREYAIAKALDPKEPTPWFYDAIAKQTTNRPVEALRDLQTSIELNDNRAVYRSRLLLDADLAARSASLGQIYNDLGFQPLGLVEGWKSINTDPANFSAHRLLADSYAVLPRHEIARVSELFQSQLLQPINITPVPPLLAESNLFLISAGGPGALSFNEFNPLFTRDRVTLQASGLSGESSTYAGVGVLAGLYKNVSFSLGGLHFTTDGFRINNDQKDNIANAFVQLELSPQTSLQAEYRYRETEQGDLQLRFFPEAFSLGERNREERNTYRLGARHVLSPSSTILGSFTHQDSDFSLKNDQLTLPIDFIDVKIPEHALSAELQHLFHSRDVNLISGAGYFYVDRRIDITVGLRFPPPFSIVDVVSSTVSRDSTHTNVYSYAYINALKHVTFTSGFSADFLSSDNPVVGHKAPFNPKFGITWNPFPATTVRAAAFKALKRTLITNQTLEPTQVAGFNQFFDDYDGTNGWRYGGAIDQKFTKDIFGGVEFSKRVLRVPIQEASSSRIRNSDWSEYLGRAYLFWIPHPRLVLSAEYLYERLKRDEVSLPLFNEVTTHRVPLGLKFFHPSGVSASLTATYVDQDGGFLRDVDLISLPVSYEAGQDTFWVLDAAVSYRLPKRYGFITVGATNLFDQRFKYAETDTSLIGTGDAEPIARISFSRNAIIQPARTFFARLTLAFP